MSFSDPAHISQRVVATRLIYLPINQTGSLSRSVQIPRGSKSGWWGAQKSHQHGASLSATSFAHLPAAGSITSPQLRGQGRNAQDEISE